MRSALISSLAALSVLAPSLSAEVSSSATTLTNWEQIHQVINLYSLAVDLNMTRQLFPQIFAQDAFANYTGSLSNLRGLQNITNALAPDAAKFGSQHDFGTTVINIQNSTYANATSYDIATLFGKGRYQGQQVQLYGLYNDTFQFIDGQGWRIKTRYYSQLGPPFGNTSVTNGP